MSLQGDFTVYEGPFQIDFDITNQCNMNCIHCSTNAGKKHNNELSTFEIKGLIDELYELGLMNITITGGEPFIRKDCLDILKYIHDKRGLIVTIVSNGLLINNEIINFLEKECPKILFVISLDGFDVDSYSILRRSQNIKYAKSVFNIVTQNLKKLIDSNLTLGINYTITKKTIKNFMRTYYYIRDLGAKNLLAIKFISSGRGKLNEDELELAYEEWSNFLIDITYKKKINKLSGLHVSITCPWELYLPLIKVGYSISEIEKIWNYQTPLKLKSYSSIRDIGCHAGITNIAISSEGSVYPCGIVSNYTPLKCGNIRDHSFKNIWNNSEVLNQLRKLNLEDIEGNCTTCEFKSICGGGCRARAYIETNKFTGQDHLCPINKGRY